jgi:hypothetical protein
MSRGHTSLQEQQQQQVVAALQVGQAPSASSLTASCPSFPRPPPQGRHSFVSYSSGMRRLQLALCLCLLLLLLVVCSRQGATAPLHRSRRHGFHTAAGKLNRCDPATTTPCPFCSVPPF